MTRNIYGFTNSGKKVKIGEYDDGLKAVGGRIFYIDPNSDETVEFYDANGNVLSNVEVGSTPVYYKITSAGTSGKDKFYVYRENTYSNKVWTYYQNNNWVYENTGFTSQNVGSGKPNTAGIMALHNGAYVTNNANGYATIWYQINQCCLNKLGECSDWYIGSRTEIDTLRSFINNYISTLGLVDLFTGNHIWSSSDNDTLYAWSWSESYWNDSIKSYPCKVIPIRSF